MRAIDADYILLRFDKRMTYEAGRNHAYLKGIRDAMKEIDAARTVDAIPVGWLIDRANDTERAPLYRRYAQMLYEEWQREQGARQ